MLMRAARTHLYVSADKGLIGLYNIKA